MSAFDRKNTAIVQLLISFLQLFTLAAGLLFAYSQLNITEDQHKQKIHDRTYEFLGGHSNLLENSNKLLLEHLYSKQVRKTGIYIEEEDNKENSGEAIDPHGDFMKTLEQLNLFYMSILNCVNNKFCDRMIVGQYLCERAQIQAIALNDYLIRSQNYQVFDKGAYLLKFLSGCRDLPKLFGRTNDDKLVKHPWFLDKRPELTTPWDEFRDRIRSDFVR